MAATNEQSPLVPFNPIQPYADETELQFWNGKTFDDFLLRPQKGTGESRREIKLTGDLTKELQLELPIVSANMDSVTAMRMARTMALEGGIGVVHRGSSIERQAAKIAQVKRSQSAIIENPECLPLGTTMRQARAFARRKNNGHID